MTHFSIFDGQPLQYGMSSRTDGSMSLSERSRARVTQQNRDAFFRNQRIDPTAVVSPLMVHGKEIAVVTETDRGAVIPQVDGLITQAPGVVLTITAADCLPVFFFDPATHTLGLVHAGRRGLAARIVTAEIGRLRQAFNVQPRNLLVALGPGVGPCHYDVAEIDAQVFREYPNALRPTGSRFFLDLRAVAMQQCTAAGIPLQQIEADMRCTFEHEQFFSARRDRKDPIEVMVAYCVLSARP